MVYLEELKILVKNFLHWIYYFVGFSFFFFIFGLKKTVIFGKTYFLPLSTDHSFSVQVFHRIRRDLLPPNIQLITINPLSAFTSQISLSLLLGFLFTAPLLIYKIITYLRPALLPREKKAVLWSLVFFTFLFLSGCAFSYFILIPATFKILYPFAIAMDALPFFSIDAFIRYVFGLMIGVGLMFLLPLFMILLSFIGIIKAGFWIKKWRFTLMFFLILSAIITPDGSGITMVMLFLPLIALYFAGCFFANKLSNYA